MTSEGQTVSGKIYASGQSLRYEMGPAITITRLDRKKTYMLMPEQKMYMEHPMDRMAGVKAGVDEGSSVVRVPMGSEAVDGRTADKFKVTTTDTDGVSTTFYQWVDESGLQLKAQAEDGSWSVVYTNLVIGAQPAELFEIPADYQPFTMPDIAQMMNGNVSGVQGGRQDQQ